MNKLMRNKKIFQMPFRSRFFWGEAGVGVVVIRLILTGVLAIEPKTASNAKNTLYHCAIPSLRDRFFVYLGN